MSAIFLGIAYIASGHHVTPRHREACSCMRSIVFVYAPKIGYQATTRRICSILTQDGIEFKVVSSIPSPCFANWPVHEPTVVFGKVVLRLPQLVIAHQNGLVHELIFEHP